MKHRHTTTTSPSPRTAGYLVFATAREGGSALVKAELESGDLTVIAVTDGIGEGYQAPLVNGSWGGGFTGNHASLVQATN